MAVLMHGKPISAIFNMLLCMFFWIPGVLHALSVNDQAHKSKQTKQIVRAVRGKKARPKKPCPVHRGGRVTATSAYDDPTIGEGGTKFKRRK
jgi:Proteolipid membrane potential modulator